MIEQVLSGHVSPETAYLVEDYPYGFRLRCQMRYWIEFKRGHGFRLMAQTSNPKRDNLVWNKPKASTYSPLMVLGLDEQNHVVTDTFSGYGDEAELDAFVEKYGAAFTEEHVKSERSIRAYIRAYAKVTWTVRTPDPGEDTRQTVAEQQTMIRTLAQREYTAIVQAARKES